MAQIVLQQTLDQAGFSNAVTVDSTGVSAEERGNPLDTRARHVLAERGYSIPPHRSRRIAPEEIHERDLILPMTARHAQILRQRAPQPDDIDHIRLYRSFDPSLPDSLPEYELNIDDPWYGDIGGFEHTLDQIEAAAPALIEWARQQLDAK